MKEAPNPRSDLRTVLNKHDPMHIYSPGVNDDEYDPEIPHILTAAKASGGPEALAPKLQIIFEQMFCKEVVRFDRWHELADDLWEAARTYKF